MVCTADSPTRGLAQLVDVHHVERTLPGTEPLDLLAIVVQSLAVSSQGAGELAWLIWTILGLIHHS